jgi:hypothetical protein
MPWDLCMPEQQEMTRAAQRQTRRKLLEQRTLGMVLLHHPDPGFGAALSSASASLPPAYSNNLLLCPRALLSLPILVHVARAK